MAARRAAGETDPSWQSPSAPLGLEESMPRGAENAAVSRPRKILSIVDKVFEMDIRVRSEAYVLADAGHGARVLCFSPGARPSRTVVEHGVVLYRFPLLTLFKKSSRRRSFLGVFFYRALSAVGYFLEYFNYIAASLLLIPFIAVRDGFDAIHFNNPPAVLCIILAVFKLLGKKLVFDHHDLEPELYLSRYRVEKNLIYRALLALEASAIRVADMVIATNESYKAIEIERGGVSAEKIFVVRNAPGVRGLRGDHARHPVRSDGRLFLVYLGIMGPQDGVDYLLRALAHLRYSMGRQDFRCAIIGAGDALGDLRALARELSLEQIVEFTGFVSNEERDGLLAKADICLDPNPSSPLNDHSTWIKVMEYMAYAKPIVSFDLKETRYTAGEAALFVKPNDIVEYAAAVATLMDDPSRRLRMGELGYARVTTELTWERSGANLIRAYEWLFSRHGRHLPAHGARIPDGWLVWPEGFVPVMPSNAEHVKDLDVEHDRPSTPPSSPAGEPRKYIGFVVTPLKIPEGR
jgi:glycosyltransferase involved in cell wall biosynthesis